MGTSSDPSNEPSTDIAIPPAEDPDAIRPRRPGVVLALESGEPVCRALPVDGAEVVVGRGANCDLVVADSEVSGRHLVLRRMNGRLTVRDLGSANGTLVRGTKIETVTDVEDAVVIAFGRSLLHVHPDVNAFERGGVTVQDGYVMGPLHLYAWRKARAAAELRVSLFVHGESGSGKDRTARLYHALLRPGRAPFVEVNAGRVRGGRADADLFGTVRGAFTGAENTRGRFVEADGGTLFLDEVGELDLATQTLLLRVLETGEVEAMGSAVKRRVDVGVVLATHRNLREMVAKGEFRGDLLTRLVRAQVVLPP